MCGIAGIVRWTGPPVEAAEVERMTDAVAHRGPDARAVEVREPAGLGASRLAIIDPAGGAQPMRDEERDVSIVYNGELYNFRALRSELQRRGHVFGTGSDTEVVLCGWLEWGERCVERFRGMFAFAVVDRREGCLFLARDPFGIKPLVYFAAPGRFCFASEIRALRGLPDCPSGLDLEALDQYLALSYIPAPSTVFTGLRKLPPAHHLTVRLDGRVGRPVRYWVPQYRPRPEGTLADWALELEHVVRESVRAHLVSDVPFGAFLSGGLDSSLVVSLMAQEMEQPVRTFTIGFDEPAFDESPHARSVAERWGADHVCRTVAADALGVLPALLTHHGEPFGDWSSIPAYHLAALARERVPMVLSGDGGDEAFGGYDRYWVPLRHRGQPRAPWHDEADASWESRSMTVLRSGPRRALWRPELRAGLPPDVEPIAATWARGRGLPPAVRARITDYQTYLPGAILTKVDIASMMHGLEVRTPLVDREVVDFAFTIPPPLLGGRRWLGPVDGKRLVKVVLSRWLPPNVVQRPKMGFAPPVAVWLSRRGPLRGEVVGALTRPGAAIADLLLPAQVAGLVAAMDRGSPAEPVWLLYVLERWLAQ